MLIKSAVMLTIYKYDMIEIASFLKEDAFNIQLCGCALATLAISRTISRCICFKARGHIGLQSAFRPDSQVQAGITPSAMFMMEHGSKNNRLNFYLPEVALSLFDSTEKYGPVSRASHWLMAIGFGWMFFTAALRFFADETPITEALWPTLYLMGFTILCLAVLRVAWAAVNMSRRPPSLSFMARLGHGVMYLLMLVIPTLALLRNYGADRPFSYLGIQLMEPTGQKIPWMVDLAALLHGELGWTLLALIVGHIAMVFIHRKNASATDVLPRMV